MGIFVMQANDIPIYDARYGERKELDMNAYYVNNDQTRNPGLHHEVHTEAHARLLGIVSKTYLGYYASEIQAVQAAKRYYWDADGCAVCCPRAHRG